MKDMIASGIISLLVSSVVAWITIKLTIRSERKRLIYELRRNTYMSILQVLRKILRNPVIIYKDEFFCELDELLVEIEVYGESHLCRDYQQLFRECKAKYDEYLMKKRRYSKKEVR